jgi:hypothetical protein
MPLFGGAWMYKKRLPCFIWLIVSIFVMEILFAFPKVCVYSRENTARYRLMQRMILENSGCPIEKVQAIVPVMNWLNLPPYQVLEEIKAKPPVYWHEDGDIVQFKIDEMETGEEMSLDISSTFRHSEVFHDPPNILASADYGHHLSDYLIAEKGIPVNSSKILETLSQIISPDNTPKEKARKIFAFVNQSLDYKVDFTREADALVALESGWGRCEDYSLLFAALCRSAGIPTRLVTGFRLDPKDLTLGRSVPVLDYLHMWAEIYLPEIGWISLDPTFITKIQGEKVVDYRFFAGFYPEDIHIFWSYGRKNPDVRYSYEEGEIPEVKIAHEFTITRIN